MKTFYVTIPIAGTLNMVVEANDKKSAIDAACDMYSEKGGDAGEVEWEALNYIVTGSVFHASCNNVEASEA